MNFNISVVIIGSNISHKIEPCILSAKKISDDIILILDNSQDDSKQKAIRLGAQVYEKPWLGYGQNKNLGINHSRYSWIFSLDSDEEISDALANSLHSMYRSEHIVYGVKRMNFIADTAIKFGSFKNDIQYRFFHKDYYHWNEAKVHEKLIPFKGKYERQLLQGILHHYTFDTWIDLQKKYEKYALLKAQEWINSHKRPSILKQYIGPTFRFIKSYIWQLGFLDSTIGFRLALEEYKQKKSEIKHYLRLSQHSESHRI